MSCPEPSRSPAGRSAAIIGPWSLPKSPRRTTALSGRPHAFIDLAADCGVDAIKFQTHIAAAESTLDEPFRVKFGYEDATRYDYWQRMEFTPEAWAGLAAHAREKGILFLSSPFSLEAVALLEALDVPAWKVASGEVGHRALVDAMLATGKPILLSSGMSSYADLSETVRRIAGEEHCSSLAILQCTTKYPTPLEDVGLNVLGELERRFGVPVGLSDHSADTIPPIAAMTLGASLIEVHVAFERRMFGAGHDRLAGAGAVDRAVPRAGCDSHPARLSRGQGRPRPRA